MEIRKLTAQDRFEAKRISAIAFHGRIDDPDKARLESERETVEDWGAFAENGKLMAHVVNHAFQAYFDGRLVRNGGVGNVSTLPEFRNEGAVSAIFRRMLPQARRDGEIISTLYPFSHAFYRKFGYETACWKSVYEFPPDALRNERFEGRAELWRPGDPVDAYTALYNRFASGYNLAMRRDDRLMLERHIEGDCYKDRKFCYLLREGERPVAYLVFQDVRRDSSAILSVRDLAWDGRAGLHALLGFLSRFSSDYGGVELFLPVSLELFSILQSPMAYDIRKTVHQDYMIRVINARKLLELMRKPENCTFVIQVRDELIPENNGAWRVAESGVTPTADAPDLIVSERALGQLASGCASLAEAQYRRDVEIRGNTAALERVFVRKPVFVEDYF